MSRWEPNAQARLQEAAFTLFQERGYDDVTVAEIAERAGLTKRSFFNHFTDKREILFAEAQGFEASIVRYVLDADDDLAPIDAAVSALTRAGLDLAAYGGSALARRELIASSPELQERNLYKLTSLGDAIANALRERGASSRIATFAAKSAVAVFATAYDDWAEDTKEDFSEVMQRSLDDLLRAIGCTQTNRNSARTGLPSDVAS